MFSVNDYVVTVPHFQEKQSKTFGSGNSHKHFQIQLKQSEYLGLTLRSRPDGFPHMGTVFSLKLLSHHQISGPIHSATTATTDGCNLSQTGNHEFKSGKKKLVYCVSSLNASGRLPTHCLWEWHTSRKMMQTQNPVRWTMYNWNQKAT